MFGENLIIGHSEGKIFDNGRIILPSFTEPEKGDQILIQKSNYNDKQALKIIAYKEYLNIINRLKRLRENSTSFEEYQKYTSEIENICNSLEYLTQVDSQKRIIFPKPLLDEYGWTSNDCLRYDGLGESLLITKKQS